MLNLYAVALTVIVAALLTVSVWQMRKVHTKADYLVAGRSLPAYVLVFTLLSSWIGAGSLFAGAENAFRNGFAALWQPAGGWAGLLIIYFVAPRARKFAQFTIPDLLEERYNTTARILGTIAILFAYTAITSYQFRAGGDILHLIFPAVAKTQGTIIIAAFVIVFTALAGMASVAYMDVVIGMLISVTGFIALPVLMRHIGGWAGLHAALPASHFTLFGEWGLTGGAGVRDNQGSADSRIGVFPSDLPADDRQSVDVPEVFFRKKREGCKRRGGGMGFWNGGAGDADRYAGRGGIRTVHALAGARAGLLTSRDYSVHSTAFSDAGGGRAVNGISVREGDFDRQ